MKGLKPPSAPAALKRRVLQAAAETAQRSPSIWSRLWESRLLRAAWTTATVGLLLANIWLSLERPQRAPREFVDARRQLELMQEELGLPAIDISPRAEAMVFGMEVTGEVTR